MKAFDLKNSNDDIEVVSLAIKKNGLSLRNASLSLKDNEDIVKLAISKAGTALAYASPRLRDDKEFKYS